MSLCIILLCYSSLLNLSLIVPYIAQRVITPITSMKLIIISRYVICYDLDTNDMMYMNAYSISIIIKLIVFMLK